MPVETQQRKPGRERAKARVAPPSARVSTARTEPGQNQSLKSPMTTVGPLVAAREFGQRAGLAAALANAQAQMRSR